MGVDENLVEDIEQQLQNDILHFWWMVNMVKRHQPELDDQQATAKLFDVLVQMHAADKIVVGETKKTKDGKVAIVPWPEQDQRLLERLVETIGQHKGLARDFCFWIELSKYHK